MRRCIQRLMKAGWLERSGGKRKDGGDCSFTYRVIYKDVPVEEQGDLLEPDLDEEAARIEENRCKNGGPPSTRAEAYKNELLITINDDQAAANGANVGKSRLPSQTQHQVASPLKHYTNGVVSALARLTPGLDVARMAGGTNPIMAWFKAGCDLEQDVKPALTIVLERAPQLPRSLNYFTQAIVSAMKSRKELAEINPRYVRDGTKAAAQRARDIRREEEETASAIREVFGEIC